MTPHVASNPHDELYCTPEETIIGNTNDYGHWPDHWKVKLFGFGDGEMGDVVTRDGEIIGMWTADENDHCSFTPNGHDEPILFNVFLGLLCSDIARWHERAEVKKNIA